MRLPFFFPLLLAGSWCVSPLAQSANAPAQQPLPVAPANSQALVLFDRSRQQPPVQAAGPALPGPAPVATVAVTDAERLAPTFTAYDLDVHLTPDNAGMAVQARVTLRNDSQQPLHRLPLQLSSTLHAERVSLGGKPLALAQHLIASDADHTGKLEETVASLPQPLAPGASVTVTVAYAGTIQPTTARLDRLETPAAVAASSDWDRISGEFTGLRGFGDVVWYPACSLPALLGDEARLFAEIGRQRARQQDATIAVRLTDEFTGAPPSIAVLAGHVVVPGQPESMPNASFAGVLRVALPATRLGFRSPGLFLAERTLAPGTTTAALEVYSTAADAELAKGYLSAAALVAPVLTQWLGAQPHETEAIIDLPVAGAQPAEQGQAVLVSMVAAEAKEIAPLLSEEVPHAWFHSPRVWLEDGVAGLMATLYEEQSEGRDKALGRMASATPALAFAEPASPGTGGGQDLLHASDPIYYRAKATDVLWMLRDLAGDKALGTALRAYDPSADTRPEYFEKLVEQASGRDLRWFFDAWVYKDRGLPDLSIANLYSSRTTQADQWLVSVDVANDGYAEAEVPVTVKSATTAVTERVRMAPRTRTSHRLLIVGEPRSVEVNDGTVPEVQANVHRRVIE